MQSEEELAQLPQIWNAYTMASIPGGLHTREFVSIHTLRENCDWKNEEQPNWYTIILDETMDASVLKQMIMY